MLREKNLKVFSENLQAFVSKQVCALQINSMLSRKLLLLFGMLRKKKQKTKHTQKSKNICF